MTADAKAIPSKTGRVPAVPDQPSHRLLLRQFPGLVAIGIYMIMLAGIICFEVVQGRARPFYLIFSVLFIAGALGLMLLLRWGWALALATVALLSASFFWGFSTQNAYASLVQGLLNLVFFLYLIRPDLRDKMK
jgi:hypothetical protein